MFLPVAIIISSIVVMTSWSSLSCVILLILTTMCTSSPPICDVKTNTDYSQRSLSIVSFDNRGPIHKEKKLRMYGRRFGHGVNEIVVLGKNCSWQPLKVNNFHIAYLVQIPDLCQKCQLLQFFNKPLYYSMWLNDTIKSLISEGKDPNDSYAILMDTDTILNARPIDELWAKFDCARKGKPVLMGGESSCWAGLQCKRRHIDRYYRPMGPTMNSFVNGGYIMGSLPGLQEMFSFISNNQALFRRLWYYVPWFCDQSAFTLWYGQNRHMAQIDDYQQVFSTLSVYMPSDTVDKRSTYVCRSHENMTAVWMHCSHVLYPIQLFTVDPDTCLVSIHAALITNATSHLLPYVGTMSPDPVVFHGNAEGKHVLGKLEKKTKACLLQKYNFSSTSGDFVLDQF